MGELNPIKSILFANFILIIFGLLFIGFGNVSFIKDSYIWILYVVYINIGIWASPIFPGIIKWAESMKPVTGLISGLIIIAFSLGDASMVLLIGHLIDIVGAFIVPFPIFIYIVLSLLLTVIGRCIDFR